jgi:hypothetical protein
MAEDCLTSETYATNSFDVYQRKYHKSQEINFQSLANELLEKCPSLPHENHWYRVQKYYRHIFTASPANLRRIQLSNRCHRRQMSAKSPLEETSVELCSSLKLRIELGGEFLVSGFQQY